jgi:putative Mn2+ efflux pump MntP
MSLFDICLLAIALAMDCFAVSIVSGIITGRRLWGTLIQMALLFGLFQMAMPLAGWLGTSYFATYLEAIDHWIAFALLALIGGNMVRESLSNEDDEEDNHFNPQHLLTQLLLAIATSIDALAIGISMACTGYTRLSQLALPLAIIGLVSFVLSIAGNLLGVRFGSTLARRLKPELLGGIILIIIGCKVLLSHIFE